MGKTHSEHRDSPVNFSGGQSPPGRGWAAIPGSRHGGYRKRAGREWRYWYPNHGDNERHEAHLARSERMWDHQRRNKARQVKAHAPGGEHEDAEFHASASRDLDRFKHHHRQMRDAWTKYAKEGHCPKKALKGARAAIMNRNMADMNKGRPSRLIARSRTALRKAATGALPGVRVRARLDGSARVRREEFTLEGGYICLYRKAVGGPAILTINGPTLALPFHMVVKGPRDARVRAAEARVDFNEGRTPRSGVYRRVVT